MWIITVKSLKSIFTKITNQKIPDNLRILLFPDILLFQSYVSILYSYQKIFLKHVSYNASKKLLTLQHLV